MFIFFRVGFFHALGELKFFELQLPDVLLFSDGKSTDDLKVLIAVVVLVVFIIFSLLWFLHFLDIKATV